MKHFLCILILAVVVVTSAEKNGRRQFPEPQQPYRRIDTVIGSSNNDNDNTVTVVKQEEVKPTLEVIGETSSIEETKTEAPFKDEGGFLDSYFGDGAQTRIVGSMNNWIVDKAKTNPGCVERFICETYKTGETFEGIPYFLMTLTNAAVSFMVAEMFDKSVNLQEITRAARYGRTMGTCHSMECEIMDNQLRTVGDFLGTFEDFLSSVFNSISSSIGK
jgi:hypothetical protein